METIHWNENFVTDLKEVDEQHHKLVDLTNQLGDLVVANTLNYKDVEIVLGELVAYTKYHFDEEEQLMDRMAVDERHVFLHKEEHENFLNHVTVLASTLSPNELSGAKELLEFLTRWLVYHILGSDQNLSRQIHAIEKQGLSSDEAYYKEGKSKDSSTEMLLDSLNGLFKQLSQRNMELTELNLMLEARVKERTQELSDANTQLEAMALTDALTNLPNRRHAMAKLQLFWKRAKEKNEPLSCMMIDADGFKQINDRYGHDAGDVVLKKLSRELQGAVRTDDIVCRLGGDEFFIICPETDLEGLRIIAETTRARIEEIRVETGKGFWYGSISIGIAEIRDDMSGTENLMKASDLGLYEAKGAGKNAVGCIQD